MSHFKSSLFYLFTCTQDIEFILDTFLPQLQFAVINGTCCSPSLSCDGTSNVVLR